MADLEEFKPNGRAVGRDVHIRADEARIGQHNGDVLLIPRTWLADAMQAKPHQLALALFWMGFGLTLGVGVGVLLILVLQGFIKAATHG